MKKAERTLYTPAEVAAIFRVDPKTVTRWAKAGKLSAVRTLGGHRRYHVNEVNQLLTKSTDAAPKGRPAPGPAMGTGHDPRHPPRCDRGGEVSEDRMWGFVLAGTANVFVSANKLSKQGSWGLRREVAQYWRKLAFVRARSLRIPELEAASFNFSFRFPDRRIRDTHNYSPVVKGILDGLVDASVIPGDDDRYVRWVTYTRNPELGTHRVDLTISEQEAAWE